MSSALVRKVGYVNRRLLYAVAIAVVVLDQLAKFAVLRLLSGGESVPVLGRYVSLTVQHNTGAAFGMFPSATICLTILAAAIVVVLIGYGPRLVASARPMAVGLGLALGGAAGNLVDRIRLGQVIDFIDLHFWPVFNVADIAITCAGVLIIIALFRRRRPLESAEPPQH